MTTIGAFDAKTHLNALLKRASKGEVIRITRRGVPIAKLVPPDPTDRESPREVARGLREIRKSATLGRLSIRDLINEGRR